jgi:uracil-DNA glycosylase family 4
LVGSRSATSTRRGGSGERTRLAQLRRRLLPAVRLPLWRLRTVYVTGTFLEAIEAVKAEAARCNECPLRKTARNAVVYRGHPEPVILFIGQSPGVEEDGLGIPFVGRSGRELDKKLLERHLPPYGITNAVLHHPPGNLYQTGYGTACAPFLRRIVAAARPRLVVTLGNDARAAYLPLRLTYPLVSIPHPAAMFHNGAKRDKWEAGWKAVWARVKREGLEQTEGMKGTGT